MSGGGSFDPFKGVGDAFSGAVNSIGHAFESVVQGIGKVGQKIIDDPLPIIEAAALTYMTGGLGAAAAEGLLAGEVAAGTISASTMAAVGTGISASISSAAVTALNGGDVSQIATAGTIAGLTAGLAQGLTSSEALKAVTASMGESFGPAITSAAGRSIAGAVGAILQGRDPLTGAVSGAVAGALTSSLSSNDLDSLSKAAVNVLGVSAGAATSSAIMGRSAAEAFGSSLLGSSIKVGLSAAMNEVKGLTGTEDIPQAIKQIQEKSQADLATYNDSVAKVQPLLDEFKLNRDTYTALDGYRKGESTSDLQSYLTDRAQANAGEQKLKVDENGNLVADNTPFKTNAKYEAQLAALGVPKDGTTIPAVTSDTLQGVVNKMQDLNTQITPLAKNFTDAQSALNTTNKQFTDISNALTNVQTLTGQYTNALTNYQSAIDPVAQMYQKYYGRDPTAAELDHWGVERATAHSLEDIENSIKTSPEAANYLASNLKNTIPVKNPDGSDGFLNPATNKVYNADGTLNVAATNVPGATFTGESGQVAGPGTGIVSEPKGTVTVTSSPNTATATPEQVRQFIQQDLDKGYITPEQAAAELAKLDDPNTNLSDVLNVLNLAEKNVPVKPGGVGSVTAPSTPGTSTNLPGDTGSGTTSPTPMPIIDLPGTGGGTGGTGAPTPEPIAKPVPEPTPEPKPTPTLAPTTGGGGVSIGGVTIPSIITPSATGTNIFPTTAQNAAPGIYNLIAGLTQGNQNYTLPGEIAMATGGSTTGIANLSYDASAGYDAGAGFVGDETKRLPTLKSGVTKRNIDYNLPGYGVLHKAAGGAIPAGHNPQFFSEGGLGSLDNKYVKGDGDGTSDSVPAMLANGEFVIPADVVSALGNGSNDAGASVLDQFLNTIRTHKQKHNAKNLPPDSKGPLAYLLEAKKRA